MSQAWDLKLFQISIEDITKIVTQIEDQLCNFKRKNPDRKKKHPTIHL